MSSAGVGGQGSGVGEAIHSYRDLRVWQFAIDLTEQIYAATQAFPRDEMFGLTSQMRRAAVSIASNIAEGHTREHTREYLHHISVAQASVAELETQLVVATRLGYVASDAAHVARRITRLPGALTLRIEELRRAELQGRESRPLAPDTRHLGPDTP